MPESVIVNATLRIIDVLHNLLFEITISNKHDFSLTNQLRNSANMVNEQNTGDYGLTVTRVKIKAQRQFFRNAFTIYE